MTQGHKIQGVMKWLRREEWSAAFEETYEQHLRPACEAWDAEIDDLVSLIGAEWFMTLWGCAFEDFLTRESADGRNIVEDYLKRRGWKESASTKTYLKGLRRSAMSLYELSDIRPGESLLARDLVRGGDPVRVVERSATRMLKSWDRVAARIVDLGHRHVFGGGLLRFDRERSEQLLDMLRRAQERTHEDAAELTGRFEGFEEMAEELLSGPELLRHAAPLFTAVWLDDALRRVIAPELPELVNGDGEALVFCTLRFGLVSRVKTSAVCAVLDAMPEMEPASKRFWNWIEERPPRGTAQPRESEPGQRVLVTDLGEGDVVLGNVTLERRWLTLETNSRERADAGGRLLEYALSGLIVGPLCWMEKTPEELMAEAPEETEETEDDDAPPTLAPEENRAILKQGLDEHYARILEEPIPVLGGRTPIEAAGTAEGREEVAEWLKGLENHLAHRDDSDPMAGYDTAWMWERLGLQDLRR